MNRTLLTLSIMGLLALSCSKDCKMCKLQELDAAGTVLVEHTAEEKCGDELDDAEEFEGVAIGGGSARFVCE